MGHGARSAIWAERLDETAQQQGSTSIQEGESQGRWQEADRLLALDSYAILDTAKEVEFDDIARIAAQVCQTPISAVNLIARGRQWFKAEQGLGVRQTSIDVSICAHAILQPGLFVVPDTTKDARFQNNPLVTGEPHLRFYAGALLQTPSGLPLGTMCVLDTKPRELTEEQLFTLKALARQVMSQLELRRTLAERRQIEAQQTLLIRELHHRVKNTLATVQAILSSTARGATNIADFQTAFRGRIDALAKTHSILSEHHDQAVLLADLVRLELAPYDDKSGRRVILQGPPVVLSSDLAVPIGMAVHELTTNAAKYGALSTERGVVTLTWDVRSGPQGRVLDLGWVEIGGPPVETPKKVGFGSRLLERVLKDQANAVVSVDYERSGLKLWVEIPLDIPRPV